MNKLMLFPFSLLSVALAFTAQAEDDQYDYIDTPTAEQPFDLTDDDSDGVVNARDFCPGTPRGALIDNDGCGQALAKREESQLFILFANNSAEVDWQYSTQIEAMAEFLAQYPETSIQLQGYASKTGSAERNLELSKLRANAVEQELLYYGVEPERIAIVGFGDSVAEQSAGDATTEALDRKVSATVVGMSREVVKEWTIFTTIPK
ncbi:OmpA family protein [Vibrio scophthalmi]|uniref:OmpA family protein n=1 Tax=Vibrio scophthalmi TaxID=45658 RepID=UPI002FF056AC